ncbi:MAG: ribosomal L7Ae/L30e/S12e/Gadd45 family protein [Firmicutes bacterium]|nr:ribosomal L7Ae/L30e/S12e/Gadd45 family protein [Bacillota bacterium]MDD4264360.1 ribosomal L7Ae/L30e/S12e/Gadd45 family protein [Bacillota bacterium]MDD4693609.1 ribosomal L7Ae/L30e/S12e/Gadd45 family protein [Bacillota bacterium]
MSLLGIARKSGDLLIGSKASEEAILRRKAKLIILSEDAGNSTKRNFSHLAQKFQIEIMSFPSKESLGALIGFKEAAVIVLTNEDFVESVKKLINSGGE